MELSKKQNRKVRQTRYGKTSDTRKQAQLLSAENAKKRNEQNKETDFRKKGTWQGTGRCDGPNI